MTSLAAFKTAFGGYRTALAWGQVQAELAWGRRQRGLRHADCSGNGAGEGWLASDGRAGPARPERVEMRRKHVIDHPARGPWAEIRPGGMLTGTKRHSQTDLGYISMPHMLM